MHSQSKLVTNPMVYDSFDCIERSVVFCLLFLDFFFFSFRWHTKYTHRVLTHKHTHTEHAHYIHHPLQVKDVNAWLMTGSFLNFSHERNKKCSLDSPCAVVVFAAIIIDVLLLFQSDFNAYTHFTLHGIMHWRRIKRNDAERERARESKIHHRHCTFTWNCLLGSTTTDELKWITTVGKKHKKHWKRCM